jgi:predicted ArsR family transcriptional regulator
VDIPTQPGDALSQPTRARLFAALNELRRPASTEELAARVGLHPNGVRAHLERMREAGLLQRRRERRRGRPRDTWTINPDAQPGGDPPTGYAELARWLVRSLVADGAHVRDVEATGRRIGRQLGETTGDVGETIGDGTAEQRLHDILVALGFQPKREPTADDRVTYRLRNCPYREAVRERQPLICGLHRGLTRGLLDTLDPKTKLTSFVPHDPDVAGCVIELRGRMAAEARRAEST